MKPNEKRLYGAIIGDICGSSYEFNGNKNYNCELFPSDCNFTDDTILTCAVAWSFTSKMDFVPSFRLWCSQFPSPKGGYGASFSQWLTSNALIGYNSLGNGSAMRVSPCSYISDDYYQVLHHATRSAIATHNHWQGIKAAQAVATCIYDLNHGESRDAVLEKMKKDFDYNIPDLDAVFKSLQMWYEYSELAEDTVPIAIWCALSATSFEDAIRKAISLGGDADTLGAITGSIAECLFEIPAYMLEKAQSIPPKEIIDAIENFNKKYIK